MAVILMDHDHLYKVLIPLWQKAPHEIWRKLAQGFQRTSHLKVWTEDARTDGRQNIIKANPEPSAQVWAKNCSLFLRVFVDVQFIFLLKIYADLNKNYHLSRRKNNTCEP